MDNIDLFIEEAGKELYSYENLMSEMWDDEWEYQKHEGGGWSSREEWARFESEDRRDRGEPSMHYETATRLNGTEWLVHFTDANPLDIIREGFKGAALEILGLTTHYTPKGRELNSGPYAHAFLANRISRNRHSGFGKYGKNAVLFKAKDAAKAFHYGDEELQVIFDIDSVYDMHAITDQYGSLVLLDSSGAELIEVERDAEGIQMIIDVLEDPQLKLPLQE